MEKVVLNWSSGKDAALAFYYLQQSNDYKPALLLTTVSSAYGRVSMHGIREDILSMQAAKMNMPLKKIYLPESSNINEYNNIMKVAVREIKQSGIHTMAFGDIFLEDLRQYREEQLATEGISAIFPLWKKNTIDLVKEVEDAGIKAIIVCVNAKHLGPEFLGKAIDRDLLKSLPAEVDPCGENGEFHTLVIDAPFFSEALNVKTGEVVHKKYSSGNNDQHWDSELYFLDVMPT